MFQKEKKRKIEQRANKQPSKGHDSQQYSTRLSSWWLFGYCLFLKSRFHDLHVGTRERNAPRTPRFMIVSDFIKLSNNPFGWSFGISQKSHPKKRREPSRSHPPEPPPVAALPKPHRSHTHSAGCAIVATLPCSKISFVLFFCRLSFFGAVLFFLFLFFFFFSLSIATKSCKSEVQTMCKIAACK